MCFDRDSVPPIPPISGASVDRHDLVLEARDGNRLAAFAATPVEPSRVGIAILPDVRGLYGFYEELALRFAELGHTAVAIDYFGRTAGSRSGTTTSSTGRTSTRRRRRRPGTTPAPRSPGCATPEPRRSSPSASASAAGTRGSPPRPTTAWPARSASTAGRGPVATGRPGPIQRAGELKAPILALMGGADQGIPLSDVTAFEHALAEAGVEHELVVYKGAPAQLLRPQARGVRGGVRRRVAPRARLRRAALLE